jgi:transcriptional regulator with XRE-family HTH domain
MTIANKREQIRQSLSDPGYRHQFVEEEINVGIAFQIRSLRNRQKLTQGNLADLMGGKQPLVSSWENPNYGKYTLGTLKDLAKAFDVGLLVRFVPFSTLVDWTVDLTSDAIAPPNFSEEEKYYVASSVSATSNLTKNEDIVNTLTGFVNRLVPDTFPSTAITTQITQQTAQEAIHA